MGRSVVFALAVAVAVASVRCATSEMAGTFAFTMDKVLDWQWKSEMQMQIRASDQDPVPLTYTVIPLTTNLGLNESQLVRGQVDIRGKVVAADATNYPSITGSDVIPYLCCDETEQTNASNLTPTAVLNALMDNNPQPAAILLYSQQGMCCGLNGNNLNFNRILTMSDNEAASETLRMANMSEGTAQAQISGNFTQTEQSNDAGQQGGNNSAVAMSILYSITGLITLLFLIIIATGAIRAHRYPERYGPRNAFGGRPRQSRAKGLARAVLETLPIVKFGDSQPKPDPNLELENGSSQQTGGSNADRQPPENGSDRHLSTIPESPLGSPAQPAASGALGPGSDSDADAPGTSRVTQHGTDNTASGTQVEEALGCSICTEDFTVGEDVRVLPCNHKFHPPCVDPWLVNVSGTCPLCRLDLRPEQGEGGDDEHNENTEAPPLGADANDNADSSNSSRRRSRLFDLHRLRHATVEERIEVLRRYRTEQRSGSSASNEEEGRDRSRLTNRLRDRFRVRTRAVQRSSERTGSSPLTATEAANQS